MCRARELGVTSPFILVHAARDRGTHHFLHPVPPSTSQDGRGGRDAPRVAAGPECVNMMVWNTPSLVSWFLERVIHKIRLRTGGEASRSTPSTKPGIFNNHSVCSN